MSRYVNISDLTSRVHDHCDITLKKNSTNDILLIFKTLNIYEDFQNIKNKLKFDNLIKDLSKNLKEASRMKEVTRIKKRT